MKKYLQENIMIMIIVCKKKIFYAII